MFSEKLPSTLADVLKESGLLSCPRFYGDSRFIAAMAGGMLVLWLGHHWLPVFSSKLTFHWQLLLSVLIWQPFIEELLFRGIIQGQLFKFSWGQRSFFNLTAANIVTSVLFVGMHMIHTPPLWSLLIFIPSVLFGYFRDTYNSIYPSMVLHSAYNVMVAVGLLLTDNALMKPFFM